jgi:ribonuclease P protein component
MPKSVLTKLIMIRKTDEFSSVFNFRKRFSTESLVVHYRPNTEVVAKVGFVVAKKVAKRAVDRNYMRRVFRELCRHELHALNGVDVVIQVKKPFNNGQVLLIRQELVMLFAKIKRKVAWER